MTEGLAQAISPHVIVVGADEDWRAAQIRRVLRAFADARCTSLEDLAAVASHLDHRGGEVVLLGCGSSPDVVLQRLRELRARSEYARPYVLVSCHQVVEEALVKVMVEGADDFLLDSCTDEEFAARLRVAWERACIAPRVAARAAELEELSARQSDFLSVVSHEIRTPLAAILSAANILVRYGSQRPESVERFGRVIQEEGRRLTRLINNLLDLSKIEAGQVEWDAREVPMAELASQVEEAFTALVGERQVKLEVTVENGVGPIIADRDKLMQVLMNLISNAVKHSPDGGSVFVRCRPTAEGGVRLEVEDEGPGIPAGAEERIFQRFQQLDVEDRNRGTGLGLTISRQIVARHQGRIWAESGRQRGALFVIELPADGLTWSGHGPVR
ncbi:MAG: hybrid sensor histidine kinase/response regulator [Acidobacteriota bacterium]